MPALSKIGGRKLMPFVIGITGGIASGKSTVAAYLRQLGYHVIDSDQVAHDLMNQAPLLETLSHTFGDRIVDDRGQLDRRQLASIVFSDPNSLETLNQLTHPHIFERLQAMLAEVQAELCFLEVPLLYESGRLELYDEVWLVWLDEASQLERLMKRNGYSYQEAKSRIDSQWPLEKKRQLADRVINNQNGYLEMKNQVNQALQGLINKL